VAQALSSNPSTAKKNDFVAKNVLIRKTPGPDDF
jgi:hypothetical protein